MGWEPVLVSPFTLASRGAADKRRGGIPDETLMLGSVPDESSCKAQRQPLFKLDARAIRTVR
jgi:hypothetical protein